MAILARQRSRTSSLASEWPIIVALRWGIITEPVQTPPNCRGGSQGIRSIRLFLLKRSARETRCTRGPTNQKMFVTLAIDVPAFWHVVVEIPTTPTLW
jgi:hypothetical protein